MKPFALNILLLLALALLSACATIEEPTDPHDPFESYNRAIYNFNDGVDKYLFKPVAEGYATITPDPAQKGISNFFSNLDDVLVLINNLLQLKLTQAASDTARIIINTSFGLFGLIDWASDIGLQKHHEDFGQTLGYWGVPSGPYFVLPFIGPSTLRDASGFAMDSTYFNPIYKELHEDFPPPSRENEAAVWGMTIVKTIDIRAKLLKAEKILDAAALDPYIFIREGYLQRRQNRVYDGHPPEEIEFSEDELFND
jgi:phospholipid-binding lipoprotein MlaA